MKAKEKEETGVYVIKRDRTSQEDVVDTGNTEGNEVVTTTDQNPR